MQIRMLKDTTLVRLEPNKKFTKAAAIIVLQKNTLKLFSRLPRCLKKGSVIRETKAKTQPAAVAIGRETDPTR